MCGASASWEYGRSGRVKGMGGVLSKIRWGRQRMPNARRSVTRARAPSRELQQHLELDEVDVLDLDADRVAFGERERALAGLHGQVRALDDRPLADRARGQEAADV